MTTLELVIRNAAVILHTLAGDGTASIVLTKL